MVAVRSNEQPGTRAQVRYARFSAYKARQVLDLIRGLPVNEAADVLRFTERAASVVIAKVLDSAVANAEHNDELDGDSLYISVCHADEGPTLKRWRPRARGRATRIRKRTCHITIVVSPMPDDMAARVEARQAVAAPAGRRSRRAQESRRARVARSRGEAAPAAVAAPTEPGDEPEATEPTEAGEASDLATTEAPAEPSDEPGDEAGDAPERVTDDAIDDAAEPGSPEQGVSADDRPTEKAEPGAAQGDAPAEADDESPEETMTTGQRGVENAEDARGTAEAEADPITPPEER
jgi:large subunit ribosomal protein L22